MSADGSDVHLDFSKDDITLELVGRLITSQFPQWAHLPLHPVQHDGWDNRTVRLGNELSVRLPSAVGYVPQVGKEHQWLPYLAQHLRWPIAAPVALGRPGEGYPFPWSVYRWRAGEPALTAEVHDLDRFAADVADFLRQLQAVPTADGPRPGAHCYWRGDSPGYYAEQTWQALATVGDRVDQAAAAAVWRTAEASRWEAPPVWFHGDIAVGNLLVRDDRLAAVIDFGVCGVGDPACDTVLAWTLFSGRSREIFTEGLALDADTWARGRGWALWKALITLASPATTAAVAAEQQRLIAVLIADHQD